MSTDTDVDLFYRHYVRDVQHFTSTRVNTVDSPPCLETQVVFFLSLHNVKQGSTEKTLRFRLIKSNLSGFSKETT